MKRWREVTFILVLSASLFGLLLFYRTYSYHDEVLRLNRDIIAIEGKMEVKAGNWTHYLEQRMNRMSKSQDEYQYSTSERIRILEEKLAQSVAKNSNKNVNINNINVSK